MMKMLYTIQIDVIAARFEGTVNGISVDGPSDGGPISYEMPINHLLIPGSNYINITISPSPAHQEYVPHTKTDFALYKRSFSDFREDRILIKEIRFPDYITNESLKMATIPITEILLATDVDEPVWLKAPIMDITPEVMFNATNVYKQFHAALKDKNIEFLLRLIQKKDEHYAITYSQGVDEQQSDSRKTFLNAFAESGNVLIEYDIQTILPKLFAGGKLLSLLNDENRSPLMYYNTETDVTTSFPVFMCLMREDMTIVL